MSTKQPQTAKTVRIAWAPNPGPQTAFIACPVREILYGGAKGGGKTDAIGPKALKHIEIWGEWACVLILRQSYPMLKEIMKRMRPLCLAMGGRYNKVDKTWTFPSGAQIIFGHTADGCDPYWGQEYSLIIIDEVTRTIHTKEDYDMLLGSLRSSHGIPCSVVLTSNPGGVGHAWVAERFMQVPPLTVIQEEVEDPETGEVVTLERVYIPALLKDNPKLPKEYRVHLAQMNEQERRAYLFGDWNAFTGSVFKIEQNTHVWTWDQFKDRVIADKYKPDQLDALGIPKDWPRFRVMDWGFSHPFSIHWVAVDYEGRAYVYREWYGIAHTGSGQIRPDVGVSLQPSLVGKRLVAIEKGESIAYGWTGPDLKSAGPGDTTAGIARIEHFQAEGIHFDAWNAGVDSRKAKKSELHERLWFDTDPQGQPISWPGIVFLSGVRQEMTPGWGELHLGAPHAIRTIPALEYDPAKGGEDIDTKMEDHPYDGISGFCLMRPWKARKQPNEIEQWRRMGQEQNRTWQSR